MTPTSIAAKLEPTSSSKDRSLQTLKCRPVAGFENAASVRPFSPRSRAARALRSAPAARGVRREARLDEEGRGREAREHDERGHQDVGAEPRTCALGRHGCFAEEKWFATDS